MITQLINQIEVYLHLRCTAKYLETWLVSNLQRILDSKDSRAIELANKIDADFVDLGMGLIDEATLYECLKGYFDFHNTTHMNLVETEQTSREQISTTVITFRGQFVVPGLVEDHREDFVFA